MNKLSKRDAVRESLMEQLLLKGADVPCFTDLIDKYMELWDIDAMLQDDIKRRGVTYEDSSSVGVKMWKRNPSVKERVIVNRQMLSILKQLKITTGEVGDALMNDIL
jgi:hypothetical protein